MKSSPFIMEGFSKHVTGLFDFTSDQTSIVRLFFTFCPCTRRFVSAQDWAPVSADVPVIGGIATMPTTLLDEPGSWLMPFTTSRLPLMDLLKHSGAEPWLARNYHAQRPVPEEQPALTTP